MAKVTVTGGRGVPGRVLVPLPQAEGHEVTVLTRRQDAQLPGDARRIVGDLATGAGLDAVPEVEVVVHLATSPFRPARVDVGGTGALVEQIRRRGSGPHLVYVSIVGVDQIPGRTTSERGRRRLWCPDLGCRLRFSGLPVS